MEEGEDMRKEAYCRWYDKTLKDVAEHEQEQCYMNGKQCMDCDDLISANIGIEENEEEQEKAYYEQCYRDGLIAGRENKPE